ncbi:MAG TPA: AMP-binding protein [Amycolatopsis sp.]|nr:AMP-binding protein [Amycolatopsis sp.]
MTSSASPTPPTAADGALSASFVQLVRHHADAAPAAPAVTDQSGTLTREELERRSNRLARAYAGLGVGPGDIVAIALPNGTAFVEAMLAVWKLGAVPQPMSHRLPPRELEAIVAVSSPALVVGLEAPAGTPSVPREFTAAAADDPLPSQVSPYWKAATSGGSTGAPKVIVALQEARGDALLPLLPLLRLEPGATVLAATPLSHNAGFMWASAALISGGHLVLMEKFDAEAALARIERHKVEWTFFVPTMLHRIARLPDEIRNRYDVSSLTTMMTGAAMCAPWIKDFCVDWLGPDRVFELYAATEAQAAAVTDGHGWRSHPGSVGRVVLGEVEVRDAEGRALPDGEVGELWVRRGPEMAAHYRYLGAAAQRDAGGWETVGDMGRLEGDWLYLTDRKTDMVVVGGANVFPAEVEAALDEHPLVGSSCVVGVPDDEYGQVLHAVVHTIGEVSDEALLVHLKKRLVPYKMPHGFSRSDTPLRDDAGKVRRSKIREDVLAVIANG